jgi:hypothetical protein
MHQRTIDALLMYHEPSFIFYVLSIKYHVLCMFQVLHLHLQQHYHHVPFTNNAPNTLFQLVPSSCLITMCQASTMYHVPNTVTTYYTLGAMYLILIPCPACYALPSPTYYVHIPNASTTCHIKHTMPYILYHMPNTNSSMYYIQHIIYHTMYNIPNMNTTCHVLCPMYNVPCQMSHIPNTNTTHHVQHYVPHTTYLIPPTIVLTNYELHTTY